MTMTKNLCFALAFGALALLLLPVTSLWALFTRLAGNRFPLFALRGKEIEDALDESEKV